MVDLNTLSPAERELVLARRAYKREWRKNNPDKVRAANERFFKKQAEKLAAEKDNGKK